MTTSPTNRSALCRGGTSAWGVGMALRVPGRLAEEPARARSIKVQRLAEEPARTRSIGVQRVENAT